MKIEVDLPVEKIEVMEVRRGDVLLVTANYSISLEQAAIIQRSLKVFFPNNKIAVVDDSISVKVGRKEE